LTRRQAPVYLLARLSLSPLAQPTEDYSDIGGLEKQIQELVEAIVLPMTHKERFDTLGIRPPKGVLLYGVRRVLVRLLLPSHASAHSAAGDREDSDCPSLRGPDQRLLPQARGAAARADVHRRRRETCARRVRACEGEGAVNHLHRRASLLRSSPSLADSRAAAADEIDAIGTKRFDSDQHGDREVQRTMLELLNQLDGFSSDDRIKVIAATNRADTLDPALLRSGRLDRKIEFPHPNEEARARILQIHARKMSVSPDVNYEELARSTDDFNAAQLKAVCVEAGILALRRDGVEVSHQDFVEGISSVQSKKKASLKGYA